MCVILTTNVNFTLSGGNLEHIRLSLQNNNWLYTCRLVILIIKLGPHWRK